MRDSVEKQNKWHIQTLYGSTFSWQLLAVFIPFGCQILTCFSIKCGLFYDIYSSGKNIYAVHIFYFIICHSNVVNIAVHGVTFVWFVFFRRMEKLLHLSQWPFFSCRIKSDLAGHSTAFITSYSEQSLWIIIWKLWAMTFATYLTEYGNLCQLSFVLSPPERLLDSNPLKHAPAQ